MECLNWIKFSISLTIIENLEKRNIPKKRIVNARSDGAVLTGKNSGVWTNLNPHFSLFSVAHDAQSQSHLISLEKFKNLM